MKLACKKPRHAATPQKKPAKTGISLMNGSLDRYIIWYIKCSVPICKLLNPSRRPSVSLQCQMGTKNDSKEPKGTPVNKIIDISFTVLFFFGRSGLFRTNANWQQLSGTFSRPKQYARQSCCLHPRWAPPHELKTYTWFNGTERERETGTSPISGDYG